MLIAQQTLLHLANNGYGVSGEGQKVYHAQIELLASLLCLLHEQCLPHRKHRIFPRAVANRNLSSSNDIYDILNYCTVLPNHLPVRKKSRLRLLLADMRPFPATIMRRYPL